MAKLIIGCGYLGRRVARLWQQAGNEVFALTRSETNANELRSLGIQPVIGDVTRPDSLARLPSSDTLLYAVGFDRTAEPSQRAVYVDGLANVLRALPAHMERVIYISSTSVYGQSAGEWVDENSATTPTRENGRICLEAETVLRDGLLHRESHPTTNVLRLAGIYGPGRLLQRVASLKAGTPLTGNPDAFLNLIHVDDAAQAVMSCETHGQPGETYLVGDNRPIGRREYYDRLAALVGAPPPSYSETADRESIGDGLNKRCSNRKMRENLHVALKYPDIEIGLPQAVGQSAAI